MLVVCFCFCCSDFAHAQFDEQAQDFDSDTAGKKPLILLMEPIGFIDVLLADVLYTHASLRLGSPKAIFNILFLLFIFFTDYMSRYLFRKHSHGCIDLQSLVEMTVSSSPSNTGCTADSVTHRPTPIWLARVAFHDYPVMLLFSLL